jgi:hypothetical protein
LKAIHGPDSVVHVNITGNDRRSHKQEYDRLAGMYGSTNNDKGESIFFKLFPQTYDPRLPVEFKQVDIVVTGEVSDPVPDVPDAEDAPDSNAEFFEAPKEEKPEGASVLKRSKPCAGTSPFQAWSRSCAPKSARQHPLLKASGPFLRFSRRCGATRSGCTRNLTGRTWSSNATRIFNLASGITRSTAT